MLVYLLGPSYFKKCCHLKSSQKRIFDKMKLRILKLSGLYGYPNTLEYYFIFISISSSSFWRHHPSRPSVHFTNRSTPILTPNDCGRQELSPPSKPSQPIPGMIVIAAKINTHCKMGGVRGRVAKDTCKTNKTPLGMNGCHCHVVLGDQIGCWGWVVGWHVAKSTADGL